MRLDRLTLHDSTECYNLVKCLSKFDKLQKVALDFYSSRLDALDLATTTKFESKVYKKLGIRKLQITVGRGVESNFAVIETLC